MAVMAPTGSSEGANDGARESIGDDDGDGAAEARRREKHAMVGAENQAHDVGHEEADVADGAADGNGEAGEHGGGNVDDNAHAGDIHAEVHGFFFPGEQEIEIGSGGVDGSGGDEETEAQEGRAGCGAAAWRDRPSARRPCREDCCRQAWT